MRTKHIGTSSKMTYPCRFISIHVWVSFNLITNWNCIFHIVHGFLCSHKAVINNQSCFLYLQLRSGRDALLQRLADVQYQKAVLHHRISRRHCRSHMKSQTTPLKQVDSSCSYVSTATPPTMSSVELSSCDLTCTLSDERVIKLDALMSRQQVNISPNYSWLIAFWKFHGTVNITDFECWDHLLLQNYCYAAVS